MMYILITGDRNWTNRARIREVLEQVRDNCGTTHVTIIHGGAKGADTIAGEEAESLRFKVERVDAEWEKYGRAAGPIRNAEMLKKFGRPNLCYAFHDDLASSKGTKNMVDQARKARITTILVTSIGVSA